MIVYPRDRVLRRARELVVVESAVYGERDASGEVPGTVVEFRIPEPGMYGLVGHDRLAYLPYGMVIPFVTPGQEENGTR